MRKIKILKQRVRWQWELVTIIKTWRRPRFHAIVREADGQGD